MRRPLIHWWAPLDWTPQSLRKISSPGVLGQHVPCGDPLPALSSIRRSVVSNGVGPIRIRPAVRTLFTEVVGHTGVYTQKFIRKK